MDIDVVKVKPKADLKVSRAHWGSFEMVVGT